MSGLEYRQITDAELASALAGLPGWVVSDGALTKLFEFSSYKDGIVFGAAVGWEADKLNHHPDIHVGYGKVRVSTSTHDTGGLTPYDLELARRVEKLA
ncbi:MAG: 4a-hydroxytetrahydrobiopterin dehydratase [Armatimonadetes bacterium]|nr:4a-hydroxytetrahydrobiopterin dehydratase [Armatimonadota bacterium]